MRSAPHWGVNWDGGTRIGEEEQVSAHHSAVALCQSSHERQYLKQTNEQQPPTKPAGPKMNSNYQSFRQIKCHSLKSAMDPLIRLHAISQQFICAIIVSKASDRSGNWNQDLIGWIIPSISAPGVVSRSRVTALAAPRSSLSNLYLRDDSFLFPLWKLSRNQEMHLPSNLSINMYYPTWLVSHIWLSFSIFLWCSQYKDR